MEKAIKWMWTVVFVLTMGLLIWFCGVTAFSGQKIEVPYAPGNRVVEGYVRNGSVDTVWIPVESTIFSYTFGIAVSDSVNVTRVVVRRANENDVLSAPVAGDTLSVLAGAVVDTVAVTYKQAAVSGLPASDRLAVIVTYASSGNAVRATRDSIARYHVNKFYSTVIVDTGSGGFWGAITGTLADQADLAAALSAKQGTLDTATYDATKTWVIAQGYATSTTSDSTWDDALVNDTLQVDGHVIVGGNVVVATGSVLVQNEDYDATNWNGDLGAPTKNAVRDKIESIPLTGAMQGSAFDDSLAANLGVLDTNGLAAAGSSNRLTLNPTGDTLKVTSGDMAAAAFDDSLGNYKLISRTFYIDSTAGNNSNSGLAADAAWKTISKINSSTFYPGDSILFQRGDRWRELLTVPSSGVEGKPIVFGAYGTGARPILDTLNGQDGPVRYGSQSFVVVQDLDIRANADGATGYGVLMEGRNQILRNCLVTGYTDSTAILVYLLDATDFIVESCSLSVGFQGVKVEATIAGVSGIIQDNVIHTINTGASTDWDGIKVANSTFFNPALIIRRNNISGFGEDGIDLYEGVNVKVYNNYIHNNDCQGNGARGIKTTSNRTEIYGNTIVNLSQASNNAGGISVTGGPDRVLIHDNYVRGTDYGMILQCDTSEVYGNTLVDVTYGTQFITSAAATNFRYNRITSTSYAVWLNNANVSIAGGDNWIVAPTGYVTPYRPSGGTYSGMDNPIRGSDAFTTTATRDALYIPGLTTAGFATVTIRNEDGTTLPAALEVLSAYCKTDSLVVLRESGATSGLKYNYVVMK